MFTKNTKYLAHVISKGVKGDFYPIIAFLNEILEHLDILILHLQTEETQTYLISFLQVKKLSILTTINNR